MAGFVPSDPWTRRYLLISWMSEVEDIELKSLKGLWKRNNSQIGNGLTNSVVGPMQPYLAANVRYIALFALFFDASLPYYTYHLPYIPLAWSLIVLPLIVQILAP